MYSTAIVFVISFIYCFREVSRHYFDERYLIHHHKLISGSNGKHLLPLDSNPRPQWLWQHCLTSEESRTLLPEPLRHVHKNMFSCPACACQAPTQTPLYWSNSYTSFSRNVQCNGHEMRFSCLFLKKCFCTHCNAKTLQIFCDSDLGPPLQFPLTQLI